MSTLQKTRTIPLGAPAANWMKQSEDAAARTHQVSSKSALCRSTGLLSLAAVLLGGLVAPVSAQTRARVVAQEQGFTLPAGAQVPVVLQTQPDATCDLHPPGDGAHALRLIANAEGYVKVHLTAKASSGEGRLELECTTATGVVTYPLHLRAGSDPTPDMPAPRTSVPAPKSATVVPALTDESAPLLTDQDLASRGYPPRPDPTTSPDYYAKWLDLVSRPMTLLPSHSVSRSDISHSLRGVELGPAIGRPAWSGYEAVGPAGERSYIGVQGEWKVPAITRGERNTTTYSSLWIGLDGDQNFGPDPDLVQAGTMHNFSEWTVPVPGLPIRYELSAASYSAVMELIPNMSSAQQADIPINPGDDFFVMVWIGDSNSYVDQNGGYAWVSFWNKTQHVSIRYFAPLGGTYVNGKEVEWIMERPLVGGAHSDLSDYGTVIVTNAAYTAATRQVYSAFPTANQQLLMYGSTGDLLSSTAALPPNSIIFTWYNYH